MARHSLWKPNFYKMGEPLRLPGSSAGSPLKAAHSGGEIVSAVTPRKKHFFDDEGTYPLFEFPCRFPLIVGALRTRACALSGDPRDENPSTPNVNHILGSESWVISAPGMVCTTGQI
jgi:hypothetical protein